VAETLLGLAPLLVRHAIGFIKNQGIGHRWGSAGVTIIDRIASRMSNTGYPAPR
jgi:hypothetical protein